MKIPYKETLSFEIYIAELIESLKPKTEKDVEKIVDELHQSIEVAASDYIDDDEKLSLDNYDPQY